jgi:hypothetical protein
MMVQDVLKERSSKRLPKFHNDEALRGKPKIERKEVGEIEVLRV